MPIPSVWGVAPALLLISFFSFPTIVTAQVQGKWECASKSGQAGTDTHYQIHCGGTLLFKADKILESTCSDGFFPSGTYWEAFGNRLTLRDSGGKSFADYEIAEASKEKLLLRRKEVEFVFRRVE